jgi:hypothetical protein
MNMETDPLPAGRQALDNAPLPTAYIQPSNKHLNPDPSARSKAQHVTLADRGGS